MKCTQCGSTEFLNAKDVYAFVHIITSDGESGGGAYNITLAEKEEIAARKEGYFGIVRPAEVLYKNKGYIKAFVCKKCGHVEFFCDTYLLQEKAEREKEAEEKRIAAEKAAASAKIEENNKLIKDLKEKAKDENITVKQQKEYFAQID